MVNIKIDVDNINNDMLACLILLFHFHRPVIRRIIPRTVLKKPAEIILVGMARHRRLV